MKSNISCHLSRHLFVRRQHWCSKHFYFIFVTEQRYYSWERGNYFCYYIACLQNVNIPSAVLFADPKLFDAMHIYFPRSPGLETLSTNKVLSGKTMWLPSLVRGEPLWYHWTFNGDSPWVTQSIPKFVVEGPTGCLIFFISTCGDSTKHDNHS
jgi:hypothetical protein